ncbi:hypothetical protein [Polaromonas sp. CG9_12]|nr:hypothetical protein [Polaromonas sp. CG9_12]
MMKQLKKLFYRGRPQARAKVYPACPHDTVARECMLFNLGSGRWDRHFPASNVCAFHFRRIDHACDFLPEDLHRHVMNFGAG